MTAGEEASGGLLRLGRVVRGSEQGGFDCDPAGAVDKRAVAAAGKRPWARSRWEGHGTRCSQTLRNALVPQSSTGC